jgi:hypothetical protein
MNVERMRFVSLESESPGDEEVDDNEVGWDELFIDGTELNDAPEDGESSDDLLDLL